MITIAVCQISISSGAVQENFDKIVEYLWIAGDEGADLVVFPELCLCGNQFNQTEELSTVSLVSNSSFHSAIQECCRNYGMTAVVGFIENVEGVYFNTVAALAPSGAPSLYRKVHLSESGVDQFFSKGDLRIPLVNLHTGRIRIQFFSDLQLLENGRGRDQNEADIVVIPTNQNMPSDSIIETLSLARGQGSKAYFVLANQAGIENGSVWGGVSMIVSPKGEIISKASCHQEDIIFAAIDVPAP